jgi:DHA1 family bicyclomycin/chloramphenicol resistance-like MFS transporter
MSPKFFRLALVLGLLSAIGPFAIDMYLPALPSIGEGLRAGETAVQMSLMSFFFALGASQLFYGPAADTWGRKAPLYFGMALFVAASVGCALAGGIEALIAWRFVQGVGAGAAMTVPRAIVRDLHTGEDAARLMSLLMLVFSVSPLLAPLVGSFITEAAGWRGIFWSVTGAGVAGLALIAFELRETRPASQRRRSTLGSALPAYGLLLRDRHFLGLTFIGAFGMSGFFIFLANSSFVMMNHYGLTSRQYSLAFSANALAFFAVAQATGWLSGRFGLARVVKVAVSGYAVTMSVLFAVVWSGVDAFAVLVGLLFVGFGFLGLVIPTTSVLALEDHGEIAGAASALMGTLQMLCGAVSMVVVGALGEGGSALTMVAGIAGCAVLVQAMSLATLHRAGTRQVG